MKFSTLIFAVTALTNLMTPTSAYAQGSGPTDVSSVLRIACDGANVKAEITINGVFKGECPVDISVGGGTMRVRAVKKVDASSERVFEEEIRMAAGTVKRINVELGREQLSAEGKRVQAARAEAKRREEEARQADLQRQSDEIERQRGARFERLRNAAEGGDVEAMATLAEVFEVGQKDMPPNQAQALIWYEKAANAGNAEAMFRLSERVEKNSDTTAQAWLRKAAQAGHRGARERLDQLPRYCQAAGVDMGIFKNFVVWSPGFEDMAADGYDTSIKALLERYAQQLRRLQPRTWDETLNQPEVGCGPMRTEYFGNAMLCSLRPAKGGPMIQLTCGSGVQYRDHLRTMETEARKNAGSFLHGTVLFDWREQ